MGTISCHFGGPTGCALLLSGIEACTNRLLQNGSCVPIGSVVCGSCQAPEMTSWAQQDLLLVYSRWTQGYCVLRLTLGRSWALVCWGWGREPGTCLSRDGYQASYSLSNALLTRSSGQPGTILSSVTSPKSKRAPSSAVLKASDHPHCSSESVVWGPETPVSGCYCVTCRDGNEVAPKLVWVSEESSSSTLPSCVPWPAGEEALPPAGPSCVPCTPVNDSKIFLYTTVCRIFLIASEEQLGNCTARVLLVT